MQRKREKSGGYTLVEMMVVLMVVSVMIGIMFMNLLPYSDRMELRHFLDQFKKDIYFAKQYAISHEGTIIIYIDATEGAKNYRVVESKTFQTLLHRKIPKKIAVDTGTMGTSIRFVKNGNITKSGKFFISSGGDHYELVFTLGRGILIERKL